MIIVWKPVGKTPLDMVHRLKEKSEYSSQTMSYAGRLDPMAEGILLILEGEENKKRKDFEALEKEYECDVLFGVATDSYDILGLVTHTSQLPDIQNVDKKVSKQLQTYIGKHLQRYPPYSSKPVDGKPLYYWARNRRLHEIEIPQKQIEIKDIQQLKIRRLISSQSQKNIHERISLVDGNFRQEEILKTWDEFFRTNQHQKFPLVTFRIVCSSGTYIRSIVNELGEKLGVSTLAFRITRIRVGKYTIVNALKV